MGTANNLVSIPFGTKYCIDLQHVGHEISHLQEKYVMIKSHIDSSNINNILKSWEVVLTVDKRSIRLYATRNSTPHSSVVLSDAEMGLALSFTSHAAILFGMHVATIFDSSTPISEQINIKQ